MLEKGVYVSSPLIANWFVNRADREAGDAITHLKVQKLVYYAEAWFLANFDRSLIDEDLQAWAHGPVSPLVYNKYRDRGWDALPAERARALPPGLPDFLSAIYDEYGQFTAKRLEALTHKELPWRAARGDLPPEAKCTTPIDRLLMRNFYGAKIGRKEAKKLSG
jgi:uncharacterized phage-associated protein